MLQKTDDATLQKTGHDAAYCYQRAEEARRMSLRTDHPDLKRHYEEMEERWIGLARSYDFAASLEPGVSPAEPSPINAPASSPEL